jgi:hypothetical protein
MKTYVENYGFSKTITNNNDNIEQNEMEWLGNYDGSHANINVQVNNNGIKDEVNMHLTNNELKKILGIQPVSMPLHKRLIADFLPRKKTKHRLRKIKRRTKRRIRK